MRALLVFVLALVVATLSASVVHTQINLASLSALGVAVPATQRLSATAHDLVYFAPLFAVVVLPVLASAVALAGWLSRLCPQCRHGLVIVLPALLMFVLLAVINAIPAVPAVIAGARGTTGMLLISAAMAAGGWVLVRGSGSAR